ncbi:MAG: pyruvate formate lyase family protein [Victivallis sp.]
MFFADCNYPDFESLFDALPCSSRRRLEQVCAGCSGSFNAPDRAAPTPLLSLLMPPRIRSGRPYNRRGAKYSSSSRRCTRAGCRMWLNSFTAVRKLIYEDECCTLNELRGILLRDFGGDERLRRMFERCAVWYGNDDGAADAMLARVVSGFAAAAAEFRERDGLLHPAWTRRSFGREVEVAPSRLATPFGRRAHDYFVRQPRSVSRHRPQRARRRRQILLPERLHDIIPNGCPLDLRFDAAALASPSGVAMLEGC